MEKPTVYLAGKMAPQGHEGIFLEVAPWRNAIKAFLVRCGMCVVMPEDCPIDGHAHDPREWRTIVQFDTNAIKSSAQVEKVLSLRWNLYNHVATSLYR